MSAFLKTKEVQLGSETVVVTQLSGLERFDFLDYCTEIPKPEEIERPADDATEQEKEQYLLAMGHFISKWERVNFTGQSRLVAYGCKSLNGDIDERHQIVMNSMSIEQVKTLHDEIAKFSGIPLPKPSDNTEESEEPEKQKEHADPKA